MTIDKTKATGRINQHLQLLLAELDVIKITGDVVAGGTGDDFLATLKDLLGRGSDFLADPENQGAISFAAGVPLAAMTNYQRTENWLSKVGKKVGVKDSSVQYGVHLEEVAENIDCASILSMTGVDGVVLNEASRLLKHVGNSLKTGVAHLVVHDSARADFLDSLSDMEVTGNGVAFLLNMDKDKHDALVLHKNDDKFLPDGTPVILPGGKVGKRPGWTPPEPDAGTMPEEPPLRVEPLAEDADFEALVDYVGAHFKSSDPVTVAIALKGVLDNVAAQTLKLNAEMAAELGGIGASDAPEDGAARA